MKVKDFTEETLDQIKEALTYRSDIDNYFSNFEWEEELSEKYKSRVDALDTFRKNLISDQENAKKDIEGREERVIALDSEIGTTMDNTCLELDDLISVLKELNQTIDSKGNFNANYDGTALRENINNIFNAKEIAQKLEEERLQKEKELEDEQNKVPTPEEIEKLTATNEQLKKAGLGIPKFDATDLQHLAMLQNAVRLYNDRNPNNPISYEISKGLQNSIDSIIGDIATIGDPLLGNGTHFASMYGYRNMGNGYVMWHNGIDMAASMNDPISSIWNGTIKSQGFNSSLGNYVVIQLAPPNDSVYIKIGHMASRSPLKQGDIITPGTYIGPAGTTGESGGVHLHVTAATTPELSYDKGDINPSPYLGELYQYATVSADNYYAYDSKWKENVKKAEEAKKTGNPPIDPIKDSNNRYDDDDPYNIDNHSENKGSFPYNPPQK